MKWAIVLVTAGCAFAKPIEAPKRSERPVATGTARISSAKLSSGLRLSYGN